MGRHPLLSNHTNCKEIKYYYCYCSCQSSIHVYYFIEYMTVQTSGFQCFYAFDLLDFLLYILTFSSCWSIHSFLYSSRSLIFYYIYGTYSVKYSIKVDVSYPSLIIDNDNVLVRAVSELPDVQKECAHAMAFNFSDESLDEPIHT